MAAGYFRGHLGVPPLKRFARPIAPFGQMSAGGEMVMARLLSGGW